MTIEEEKLLDDCVTRIKHAVSEGVKNVPAHPQQEKWKNELKQALEKKCDGYAARIKKATVARK